MGSPVSPVIANIYMENFEEITLCHECPLPTPWWKGYVSDVINIVKQEQVDTLLNHLHSVDPYIKFILEAPGSSGSISFLDTKHSLDLDYTMHTSV